MAMKVTFKNKVSTYKHLRHYEGYHGVLVKNIMEEDLGKSISNKEWDKIVSAANKR